MAIAAEALRGMRRILSHRSAPPAAVKEAETPRFTSIEAWANSGQAATAAELGKLVSNNGRAPIDHISSLAGQSADKIVFTGRLKPPPQEAISHFQRSNPEYVKEHGLNK